MMTILRTSAVAALLALTGTSLVPGSAHAEGIDGQAYVAKFVCGENKENNIVAMKGKYATTINIANPNPAIAVCGNIYVTIANDQHEPRGPISPRAPENIGPSEAVGIDCDDIKAAFDPRATGFLEGFMVFEVIPTNAEQPPVLSVTSVYTAKKRTPGSAAEPKEWDVETMTVVPTTVSEVEYPLGSTPTFPCL